MEHAESAGLGGLEAELEALGGEWYTRGFPGAFYRVEDMLMLAHISAGVVGRLVSKDAPPLSPPAEILSAPPGPCRDLLRKAMFLACGIHGQNAVSAYYQHGLSHLYNGYCKAGQRWGTREQANGQFREIFKAYLPYLWEMTAGVLPVGSRLTLRYGGGYAEIEPIATKEIETT